MNAKDVENYQKKLSDMKMQYARMEERKINLETQLNDTITKLKELGYEPEDTQEALNILLADIESIEQSLQEIMQEAEGILTQ